jgi:hypothetical protein
MSRPFGSVLSGPPTVRADTEHSQQSLLQGGNPLTAAQRPPATTNVPVCPLLKGLSMSDWRRHEDLLAAFVSVQRRLVVHG